MRGFGPEVNNDSIGLEAEPPLVAECDKTIDMTAGPNTTGRVPRLKFQSVLRRRLWQVKATTTRASLLTVGEGGRTKL